MKSRPAILALLAALAGCNGIGPTYQRPQTTIPAQFVAASPWKEAVPGDLTARGNWWELFGDAALNELEQDALKNSPRLQAATARVDQARAIAGTFDAAILPRVDLGVDISRQ